MPKITRNETVPKRRREPVTFVDEVTGEEVRVSSVLFGLVMLIAIVVALAKFISNKRCPNFIYEAMECLGGIGYVEESPLPLLYREAPLNSIWEGSGNVICLDILRSLTCEPLAGEVLFAEINAAKGADRRFDDALKAFHSRWPGLAPESEARWFAERLAVLLQGSILLRHAPDAIADGFIATRVAGEQGWVLGAVSLGDTGGILARL